MADIAKGPPPIHVAIVPGSVIIGRGVGQYRSQYRSVVADEGATRDMSTAADQKMIL